MRATPSFRVAAKERTGTIGAPKKGQPRGLSYQALRNEGGCEPTNLIAVVGNGHRAVSKCRQVDRGNRGEQRFSRSAPGGK